MRFNEVMKKITKPSRQELYFRKAKALLVSRLPKRLWCLIRFISRFGTVLSPLSCFPARFLFAIGGVIAHLFTDGKLVADVAGPIGIGSLVHQFTQLGFPYLIQLTAVLSINLAIINALPFPALDGGRFLFLLIEAVKGSPLNQKFEKTANTAGFALLILLLILITVKDVMKWF